MPDPRKAVEIVNPFPYPGARGLLIDGKPAAPVQPDADPLVQALITATDALTVLTFGSPGQRQAVEQWMEGNRRA